MKDKSYQSPLSNTLYYLLLAYLGRRFHCTYEDHIAVTFNSLTAAYRLNKILFDFFCLPEFQFFFFFFVFENC